MKTVINYPAWHDEARAMRDKGKTLSKIADHFGFTTNRMGQIATPNWKAYLIAVKRRDPAGGGKHATVGSSIGLEDQYEFVPVPTEGPPKPKPMSFKKSKDWVKPGDEFMPSIRDFKPLKKYEGGKVMAGAQIECSICHKEATYFKTNGSVNPVYLPKEFERMGWTVGKTARGDLCPEHSIVHQTPKETILPPHQPAPVTLAPIKSFDALGGTALQRGPEINARHIEAKVVKEHNGSVSAPPAVSRDPIPQTISVVHVPKEVPKVSMPVPVASTGLQSLVPAPMDKVTHRIIFAKLNEVYLDEKTGYAGEWNDAKVALDLGIDVGHVAEVRTSFFGPETNASLMRAAIDNIVKAGQDIERRVVLIDKKIEQMQALDDKLEASRKEVEAAIDRFEQLMTNLTQQDNNMQGLISDFNTEVSSFKKLFAELKQ